MRLRSILCLGFVFSGACASSDPASGNAENVTTARAELRLARGGAVFTITNESEGNRVLSFARESDGSLGEQHAYDTGGTGTGDSLGSQAALALTEDHRFLLAVDAGSN